MRTGDRISITLANGNAFQCTVCGGTAFRYREIKMNTTGMSFLGWDWANAASDGAVCEGCDYVHQFFGNTHAVVDL